MNQPNLIMENQKMTTLEELHQHYKAVRARLNGPAPVTLQKTAPMVELALEPVPKPVIRIVIQEILPIPLTPSQQILKDVAVKHEMMVQDIKGQSRKMKYVWARQEAAYRMSTELKFSLPKIGRQIGFRDHTTILNLIRKYKKRHDLN